MKNGIKEILDDFKNDVENNLFIAVRGIYYKPLLDYITSLQELCDKYEEEQNTTFKEWQKDIQANKKAIEYIKQHTDKLTKIRVPKLDFNYEDLLKILEGKNEYNK